MIKQWNDSKGGFIGYNWYQYITNHKEGLEPLYQHIVGKVQGYNQWKGQDIENHPTSDGINGFPSLYMAHTGWKYIPVTVRQQYRESSWWMYLWQGLQIFFTGR